MAGYSEPTKDLVSMIASICGMVLGTAGFVLSVTNYLRDRTQIKVYQQWNEPDGHSTQPYLTIHVRNLGRRPAFIMRVGIELPEGHPFPHLELDALHGGKRLAEGDPPMAYKIESSQLVPYAKQWRELRAVAIDLADRHYYAKRTRRNTQAPSWIANLPTK